MEWISVEDELPSVSYPYVPGEWVLGWDTEYSMVLIIARTHIDHKDNAWEWKDEYGDSYHNVTHWMPLPAKPYMK